jgi:hypothetical protein
MLLNRRCQRDGRNVAVLGYVLSVLLFCCKLPPVHRDRNFTMSLSSLRPVCSNATSRLSPQQFAVHLLLQPARSPHPCSMHSQRQTGQHPTPSSLPRAQADRADVVTRSTPTDSSSALPLQQQRPTRFLKYGITGDGSCMFRACVQGHHQLQHGGQQLPSSQEYSKALELRVAVVEELRKNRA